MDARKAADVEVPVITPVPCVVRPETELGEGAIWDARSQRLLWLDVSNSKLFRLDVRTWHNEVHDLSSHSKAVSSVVPLHEQEDASGDLVGVTVREGFAVYNLRTKELNVMPGNPPLKEGERFNDGKVDPAGRYWAGTMATNADGQPVAEGALYRRGPDGAVEKVLTGVSTSNGIVWTADQRTMYYTDTATARIDAFDFDGQTGEVSNRRPCVEGFDPVSTGSPDGCTIDSEGMLWVARFGGGCAGRYNPTTGDLLAEVRMPAEAGPQVTSVAFGGDGLGDLFLTTAHEGKDQAAAEAEGHTLAGSLFRVTRQQLDAIGAAPGLPIHGLRLSA